MWQKEKKDSGIVNLALFFALITTPMAVNLLVSAPLLAQSETDTPTFKLPPTVEKGTTVRIDGSSTLAIFNQNLKQSFEQKFAGTKVEVAANGTESALKALLDGKIDVATIGRGLTPAEKAQGLEQVRLYREKIAIIVGEENPFKGSLTDKEFARIFRGRISNWSQLGAPAAKIRVIDRPSTSDTRQALNNYPVFKAAKFATGTTAIQVNEDNTTEIVKQLGKDGISYTRANQVKKLPGVRILSLHDTSPSDPKYPFSQPLVYVYKKSPNPGIAAFLGFALASPGQKSIETARVAEAEAIAKGEPQVLLTTVNPANAPTAATTLEPIIAPTAATTLAPIIAPTDAAAPGANTFPNADSTNTNLTQPGAIASPEAPKSIGRSLLWWLLLPVGAIGGLVLWFMRRPLIAPTLDSDSDSATSESEVPKLEESETTLLVEVQNHTNPNLSEAISSPRIDTSAITANGAKNTNHSGNGYSVIIPPELEQSPWDMEAPASVVNTSYSQMIEVGKNSTYIQPKTADITNDIAELPNIPDIPSIGENHQELTVNWSDTSAVDNVCADEEQEDTSHSNIGGELLPPSDEDRSDETVILPELPDFYQIFAEEKSEETIVSYNGTATAIQVEADDTILAIATTELPTAGETTPDTELATTEFTAPVSQLSDIPEDALNLVADAAEFPESETLEETEYLPQSNLGTLVGSAALAGVGIATWANMNGMEDSDISQVSPLTNTADEPTVLATTSELQDGDEESSVVLRSRNPEWAYVSWYVSQSDQQKLQHQGSPELALRLYDVTDIDLSYQHPIQVQQHECAPGKSDYYLPIPDSDRDYMIEIGYLADDQWLAIARSAPARVFNRPQMDVSGLPGLDEESSVVFSPRSPKWAYVSWELSETHQQSLKEVGITQLALRLYDATNIDLSYQNPQLVQQYEFDEITRDRYVAIPNSDRDYMAEIGYGTIGGWITIARSATVRVFNSPHGDFWFVADTELIIHGATDPDTTVTIAGKPITLKSDGTFHLRIPFSEDLLEYLITVASGEQRKTIHKQFSQKTTEA